MASRASWCWSAACLCAAAAWGEAVVTAAWAPVDEGFALDGVPLPARDDAAAGARVCLADGAADPNAAPPGALVDGAMPERDDEPAKNFFFRAGSDGGRIVMDLGRRVSVKRVSTYSWHVGGRGPQVYTLYGADGGAQGFREAPARGVDPAACGWRLLARVDTRPADGGAGGGQHAVAVSAASGTLGTFRYLLFDAVPAERRSAFGNTFFSEVDVAEAGAAEPPVPAAGLARTADRIRFGSEEGEFRYVVDVTDAPDLRGWSEARLKPLLLEWYPRLVALLPGEGFQAPRRIFVRFRKDMKGTPASAGGGWVNLNAEWVRRERDREAPGAVVHELAHVVQAYGRPLPGGGDPAPVPGWIVEGVADYVRWFVYEPQSRGAEISLSNLGQAAYDGSYRVSANFLDWAERTYGAGLVARLNAAAREGRYRDALWKEWTGAGLDELGAAWKRQLGPRAEAP